MKRKRTNTKGRLDPTAYLEGYRAFWKDLKMHDCPHKDIIFEDNPSRMEWKNGWLDAHQDHLRGCKT